MAKLYIVPTPIGNLGDMTYRAVDVLREADLVLAEDTRTSSRLLKHYQIDNKLQSHHKFNEHKTAAAIAQRIEQGENVALISDAGTPGISDPGFLLIRTCLEIGIDVECLPGATAFVPALVGSGIPCDKFCFEGFLPQKKGRQKRLSELASESRTLVFYESPHRLLKSLQQFLDFFGNRTICVCRELTKLHEEKTRGTIEELITHYTDRTIKGEIVIIVEGKVKKSSSSNINTPSEGVS